MTIQPIVEGDGEIAAVPVLLRRLAAEAALFSLEVEKPILRHRRDFSREDPLRRTVELALLRRPDGILILFDSDRECPRDLVLQVQGWARAAARGRPCEVVIAHCEYETWFLAGLESLRGHRGIRNDVAPWPDPESFRGAKEKLQACLVPGRKYLPTQDQAALTSRLDLALAHRRSRSFRRLVRAFGLITEQAGGTLPPWPPPGW